MDRVTQCVRMISGGLKSKSAGITKKMTCKGFLEAEIQRILVCSGNLLDRKPGLSPLQLSDYIFLCSPKSDPKVLPSACLHDYVLAYTQTCTPCTPIRFEMFVVHKPSFVTMVLANIH